jgi:DNA-binding PadR family transcriptional regulator
MPRDSRAAPYYTVTDSGKHALLEATRRIKALDEMLASHAHEPKTSGR